MELSIEELAFLEESLQRDAVGLLRAGCSTEDTVYIQNRKLFSRVWDRLYKKKL